MFIESALILDIAGIMLSTASFAISIFQFKSANSFRIASDRVKVVTKAFKSKYDSDYFQRHRKAFDKKSKLDLNSDHWNCIEEWLSDAEVVVGLIQKKINRSISLFLSIFLGTNIFAIIDFPDENDDHLLGWIESHDLFAWALLFFLSVLLFTIKIVVSDSEKTLLKNYSHLYIAWYESKIKVSVSILNQTYKTNYSYVEDREDIRKIRNAAAEYMTKLENQLDKDPPSKDDQS